MTRWIMIALTLAGFGTAIVTHSPGMLGLGLLAGVVGLFGVVFSLAADRISANARPDSTMLQPDVIAAMRARAQAQANAQPPLPRPVSPPPRIDRS